MYKVESTDNYTAEDYESLIRSNYRRLGWQGTITDNQGRSYIYKPRHIVSGSGKIIRSCAGSTDVELGSVYASEFDIGVYADDLGITDRYTLYGGEIDIYCVIYIAKSIETWMDASANTWEDLSDSEWGSLDTNLKIPLGRYTIQEATRTAGVISIKAYDYMLKFEKDYRSNGSTKAPYKWLSEWCRRCGIEFGMTADEIEALPNGSTAMSLIKTDDIKTYRDTLSHLAAALCSVAQIDRLGRLVLVPFGRCIGGQNIKASQRFSSTYADYITHYSGLYATYAAGGMTEYFKIEPDDGLIYNIGTNGFLQIEDTAERHKAVQAIIDNLALAEYTPFSAEIPMDPCLDPMDILSFSGGHAANEISLITEIELNINGSMAIKCVGENPALNEAKSRYTKDIEGLQDSNNGIEGTSTFWLSDAYSNEDLEILDTLQSIAACSFKISTDRGRGDINFTAGYNVESNCAIQIKIYVDDEEWYALQEDKQAGDGIITVTSPFAVSAAESEEHTIRIEMACIESEKIKEDTTASDIASLQSKVSELENALNELKAGGEESA